MIPKKGSNSIKHKCYWSCCVSHDDPPPPHSSPLKNNECMMPLLVVFQDQLIGNEQIMINSKPCENKAKHDGNVGKHISISVIASLRKKEQHI